METDVLSLTEASPPPLPIVADCTVNTDMLGEDGPSPLDWRSGLLLMLLLLLLLLLWLLIMAFLEWHVAVEIAVAREMGMRQRPLPCKYCMAEPMSSSMSLATWCSVTVRLSLDDAVWLPLELRPRAPLLAPAWIQSPPPYKDKKNTKGVWLLIRVLVREGKRKRKMKKRWIGKKGFRVWKAYLLREREESEKVGTRATFVLSFCGVLSDWLESLPTWRARWWVMWWWVLCYRNHNCFVFINIFRIFIHFLFWNASYVLFFSFFKILKYQKGFRFGLPT